MQFKELFPSTKPVIACIHLLPLPGAPGYSGNMEKIFDTALRETKIYNQYKIDGLIVENFRDIPFYPGKLPAETIAALSSVTREIVKSFNGPVGVNALRNDAVAALSVAVAAEAHFIRVNVHTGAAITDQGIIEGKAYKTLRLRKNLDSEVLIFADVAVKHAAPLTDRGLGPETKDLAERGMADAIIVSGEGTGMPANTSDIETVRKNTHLPILLGSGVTPENINTYHPLTDGFIVGSYFKKEGKAINEVDDKRVKELLDKFNYS